MNIEAFICPETQSEAQQPEDGLMTSNDVIHVIDTVIVPNRPTANA